jgi:predicted phage terminase large subunit-like protein
LASIKRDVGSLVWAAEYQGAPTAAEGTLVKRAWLRIVPAAPATLLGRIRYWDKAASTSKTAKFTAGVRLAYGADGLIYIENVVRGQWTTGERRQVMRQTAQLDGREVLIGVEQEPGSSGLDSVQDDIRLLMGFAVFADRPSGDKDTRMMPFVAQAEAGNVRLVAGDWNQDFIDELCAIPNGRYRDQSDATAGAFNRLIESLEMQVEGLVVVDEAVSISPY